MGDTQTAQVGELLVSTRAVVLVVHHPYTALCVRVSSGSPAA